MRFFVWPWTRARLTDELADELRAHLEMAEADRVARGESRHEAAAAARREFGNVGLVQELSRDEWSRAGTWLEQLGQDVRFALRSFRRAPGFTAVAALTVALGIGATTAIFSVVDATLLHPLPYPHPEQLVRIEDDLAGIGARDVGMSIPEWHDLERSGAFARVSPTWFDDNNMTGVSRAQHLALMVVAPNYFAVLGVTPEMGATFDAADGTPGFNEQAVISDGLWTRVFGRDPSVIGCVVQMDSDSYRIIGVMPPGFQAPQRSAAERRTEAWVAFGFAGPPLLPATVQRRSGLFPGAIARLGPGLTLADAQRHVDEMVRVLRRDYPADYPPRADWRVRLVPLQENVVGDTRQSLLFLLGAVAVVLLIGCANVANLLLARASSRSREMAVRQAVGGSPARLTRQLLTESLVLSVIGGTVGVAVLIASTGALVRVIPESVPRLNDIAISWRVVGFAFAVALAAGAIFGIAPALDIRRIDILRVMKQEGRGSAGSREQYRARRVLVVAELALSLVLLTAAGLLVRGFWETLRAPLGFDARGVTIARTRLPYPNNPNEDLYATAANEAPFVRNVMRRLAALAGVEEVAMGSGATVPLDHPQQDSPTAQVVFEGAAAGDQPVPTAVSEVTPGYFHLLSIPLVSGRRLDDLDTDKRPSVVVVNEAFARTYWPTSGAIGKRIKLSRRATEWTTVVGVVADARTESLDEAHVPELYTSLYQQGGKHLAILLRGHLETAEVAREVRDQVQAVNAALPVFGVVTLEETIASSLAVRRFTMELLALFACTALVLAALGIYGVVAYMVGERTHEIGVRLTLGAGPGEVMRMILAQGARLCAAGGAIGFIGALVVARAMRGLVVGVDPSDPWAFGLAMAVLTIVAFVGCYVPARRATRIDPIVALKY